MLYPAERTWEPSLKSYFPPKAELNAAFCLDARAKKQKYAIFYFPEWESNPRPTACTVYKLVPYVYKCDITNHQTFLL